MDDEREQIEQMRAWWSDYGNWVIGGVVLGALGLFGYNYWSSSRVETAYAASETYGELTDLMVEGDLDAAEALSAELLAEHPRSPYAAQARLALARLYMDNNRDQDAVDTLTALLDSDAAEEEYRQVARLRLARVLLYQDKPAEVLDLLGPGGEDEGAFAARYAEARADAFVALGRLDDAREAYNLALSEAARDSTVNQEFVQLKLLDLPTGSAAGTGEPAGDVAPAGSGEAPVAPAPETAPAAEPRAGAEAGGDAAADPAAAPGNEADVEPGTAADGSAGEERE